MPFSPSYVEQTNKQTNRQTNKQTNRQSNKQTDKQTDKQTNRQTNKQTDRQTDKQTNKQTNKQTSSLVFPHLSYLATRTAKSGFSMEVHCGVVGTGEQSKETDVKGT